MTTLNVCSRLSQRPERFQVSVQGLDSTVESLRKEIQKQLDLLNSKDAEFDIIYCGQVLMPARDLSSYMLQGRSTLYVVKKFSSRTGTKSPQHPEGEAAQTTHLNKDEVTMAVQTALLNPDYRSIVQRMVTDPETVENLFTAIPGLGQDPAVLAMLQQPELLAVLSHRKYLDNILQKHPAFAQAAISVAKAVTEEAARRGTTARTAEHLTYSMDQMSDDEDEQPGAPRMMMQGNPGGSNITTSQLAAAIQAVTGSGSMAAAAGAFDSMPSTSQGAPGPSSSSTITSDFFQQAMAHAQSASSDAALQQLREMGITDENVARQALAATGGDIQAAIDLIFGDGLM